jgi:hypothetical protein
MSLQSAELPAIRCLHTVGVAKGTDRLLLLSCECLLHWYSSISVGPSPVVVRRLTARAKVATFHDVQVYGTLL